MMKLDDAAQDSATEDQAPVGDQAAETTDDTSTDAEDGAEDDNGDEGEDA